MANWWDNAPLSGAANWWEKAPLAKPTTLESFTVDSEEPVRLADDMTEDEFVSQTRSPPSPWPTSSPSQSPDALSWLPRKVAGGALTGLGGLLDIVGLDEAGRATQNVGALASDTGQFTQRPESFFDWRTAPYLAEQGVGGMAQFAGAMAAPGGILGKLGATTSTVFGANKQQLYDEAVENYLQTDMTPEQVRAAAEEYANTHAAARTAYQTPLEFLPFSRIFGRAGSGIPNVIRGGGEEAVAEGLTYAADTGYDVGVRGEEAPTLGEFTRGLVESAGAGAAGGAVLAGGTEGVAPARRLKTGVPAFDAGAASVSTPENASEAAQEIIQELREQEPAKVAPQPVTAPEVVTEPPVAYTPELASEVVNRRLSELSSAIEQNSLPEDEIKRLVQEDNELVEALREHESSLEGVSRDPRARLSPEELQFITNTRNEIKAAIEGNRAARAYQRQFEQLQGKLQRADNPEAIISLAEEIQPAFTPVQLESAAPSVQEETVVEADPLAFLDEPPSNIANRVEAEGDVIRQMEEEGIPTSRRNARFAELMTARGFPTEARPDAQARTERPRQQAPIVPEEPARVQEGGTWRDGVVTQDLGDDVAVQLPSGEEVVKPRSEVERMERSPEYQASASERVKVGREVLQQLRDEDRVGDTARFNELMEERGIEPQYDLSEDNVPSGWSGVEGGIQEAPKSIEEARSNLLKDFGNDAPSIQKLIDGGVINLVQSTEIPSGVLEFSANPENVRGWRDRDSGSIGIVWDRVPASQMRSVVMHELGGHGGLQQDTKRFGGYVNRVIELADTGNEVAKVAVSEVKRRVDALREAGRDMDETTMKNELVAHFIQEMATKVQSPKGLTGRAKTIYNQLKAEIKQWLNETFGADFKLTDKDMFALAEGWIRRNAKNVRTRSEEGTDLEEAPPSSPDPNTAKYAEISTRIGKGQIARKNIPEETLEARKIRNEERELVRNVRLRFIKQYPDMDVNSPEFNQMVGQKAADVAARRAASDKAEGAVKEVLDAQGSPQGFTKTAKQVLAGRSKAAKYLKSVFNYRGGVPKEIYRNAIEIPGKGMDGVNYAMAGLQREIDRAMGKNPSPELYNEFLKAVRGQENTLTPEQLAVAKKARATIDKELLELADIIGTDSKQSEAILDSILEGVGRHVNSAYRKDFFKPWGHYFLSEGSEAKRFIKLQQKEAPEVLEKAFDVIRKNYLIPETTEKMDSLPSSIVNSLADKYGVRGESRQIKQQNLAKIRETFESDAAFIDAVTTELFTSHPRGRVLLQSTRDARKNPLSAYTDVDPAIKEAWGPYAKPSLVVAATMSHISSLTKKIQAYNWLAESGIKDGYIFDKRPEGYDDWKQVPEGYGELTGKWANPFTRDILDQIDGYTNATKTEAFFQMVNDSISAWGRLNSIPKLTKTALSLPAIVTQGTSNAMLTVGEFVAGGRPKDLLTSTVKALQDVFGTTNPNAQVMLNKLVEIGALRDGLTLGELRGQTRKIEKNLQIENSRSYRIPFTKTTFSPGKISGKSLNAIGQALEKAGDFYQLTDNIPKLFGYFNAVNTLSRIYPEKSRQDIEEMAADRVMDRYPTFSRAFPVAKAASRIMGNYATWPAETLRTFERNYTQFIKDLKEADRLGLDTPEGRLMARYAIGQGVGLAMAANIQPIVFTAAAAGIGSFALSSIASFLPGEDEEEKVEKMEEYISAIVPEWMKNFALRPVVIDRNDGTMVVIDEGRIDPFGPTKEVLRATKEDGLEAGAWQAGRTLFGPGPLLSGLIEVVSGRDRLTKEKINRMESAIDIFKPGQVAAIERMLKNTAAGDDNVIADMVMAGVPLREIDGERTFRSKSYQYKRAIDDNRENIRFVLNYAEELPKEAVEAATIEWLQEDKLAFDEARLSTEAHQQLLGMNDDDIRLAALPVSGTGTIISKDRVGALLRGNYSPTSLSDKFWEGLQNELVDKNQGVPGSESLIKREMAKRRRIFESTIRNYKQYVGDE